MNWLKRLLGKQPSSEAKVKGSEVIRDTTINKKDKDTPFELCCIKCGARYSVGEDAVMVTMDMAKSLADTTITVKSDDPSSVIRKDLVSFVSGVPADRRTSVLTQARETVRSLRASLKDGEKRVWICFQCKALNDYPQENASGQNTSSFLETAQSQNINVIVSDNKIDIWNTILVRAAETGHLQNAKESIDAGADVNITLSTGATPLMLAIFDGHTDIVRLLLDKGANPNCTLPGKNVTALMIAAQNNHIEIAKLLLEKNVDINVTTVDGIDAKLIAEKNGHTDILMLLNQKTMDLVGGAPSASAQEDEKNVPFLECTGNDAEQLTCSYRACPCGDPGKVIPHGEGYLYIWKELVEARKDFLNDNDLRTNIIKGSVTYAQERAIERAMATEGSAYPILMCEQAARMLGLNLEVAAEDAFRWWETGRVPLRPTPFV
jgi:hypothetical protein